MKEIFKTLKAIFKLKEIPEEILHINKSHTQETEDYNNAVKNKNTCLFMLFLFGIGVIIGYLFMNGFTIVSDITFWDWLGYGFTGVLLEIFAGIFLFILFSSGNPILAIILSVLIFGLGLSAFATGLGAIYKSEFFAPLVNIPVPGVLENVGGVVMVGVLIVIPLALTIISLIKNTRKAMKLHDIAYYTAYTSYTSSNENHNKKQTTNNKNNTYHENNYNQNTSYTAQKEESISFFAGCTTFEEAKKRRRELSNLYHPDKNNGDTTMMQKINADYDEFIKRFN